MPYTKSITLSFFCSCSAVSHSYTTFLRSTSERPLQKNYKILCHTLSKSEVQYFWTCYWWSWGQYHNLILIVIILHDYPLSPPSTAHTPFLKRPCHFSAIWSLQVLTMTHPRIRSLSNYYSSEFLNVTVSPSCDGAQFSWLCATFWDLYVQTGKLMNFFVSLSFLPIFTHFMRKFSVLFCLFSCAKFSKLWRRKKIYF